MRTRISLALSVLLALTTLPANAQEVRQQIQIMGPGDGPIQMPGMPGRQFKTGTGRIRGRVLAVDGGGPIRRAQVRISGSEIAPKAALTDAEGRYDFRDLPAGRFTLQATKSGFVNVQYGQMRPLESGKPIELADKQVLDNADISMPRGSVISGRIVDEFGDPVPDVMVTAMRQTWSNGRRRLTPSPGRIGQTNDLGQFRVYGLPPGEYYISATLRGGAADMAMMEMEVMMGTGVAAAGPTASTPRSGYANTYYPGTPNVTEAQRITLAVGQESANADFALVPVRLARVTGIVIGSDGKPLEGAMITAQPATGRGDFPMFGAAGGARSGKDGSFTLTSVPPGDYTLQARSVQVFTSAQGDDMMFIRAEMRGGPGGAESESGSVPLSVAGEDVPNVILTTNKGGTATGQLNFDGGAKPPSITALRITAPPIDVEGPMMGMMGGGATIKEDGSFELKGLSGMRLIRIANAPPGWMLKSVRLNGTDITDAGNEFKPGETATGLEIVLSPRGTTVAGGVTTSDGTPLKDYTVVIFSDSPEHWRLPMTRWVTGARPDQDGRFKVQNLPAGSYYAVAIDYLPQGEWGDPEVLERLKEKARRFSLDEGGSQSLDLRLSGGI
jgi:protocatechuate 3,4-dioxygenase beta subunit